MCTGDQLISKPIQEKLGKHGHLPRSQKIRVENSQAASGKTHPTSDSGFPTLPQELKVNFHIFKT